MLRIVQIKNLGNYFINKLTSENSSAYSITDAVLLLGDHNLNYFKKEKFYGMNLRLFLDLLYQTQKNQHEPRRNTNKSSVLQQKPISRGSEFLPIS